MTNMKDDYTLNDKDIAAVVERLKVIDPNNADKDYAIQLLELMQTITNKMIRSGEKVPDNFDDLFNIAIEKLAN
jgi:hypothetical protein